MSTNNNNNDNDDSEKIRDVITKCGYVVFTCTYYTTTNDIRFQQCLQTLRHQQSAATDNNKAHAAPGAIVVVVDGSPCEAVQAALQATGAIVHRQLSSHVGKGGALRQAAAIASQLPGVDHSSTLLCWQEPEKTNMMAWWPTIVKHHRHPLFPNTANDDDVVIPYRDPTTFMHTYPMEQYHSESYGNLYLDCVMEDAIKTLQQQKQGNGNAADADDGKNNTNNKKKKIKIAHCRLHPGHPRSTAKASASKPVAASKKKSSSNTTANIQPQPSLQPRHHYAKMDWHFGPFAFKAKHVELWTAYKTGQNSYDAQLVPIVHAIRKGLTVSSIMIEFELSEKMRHEEQGNVAYIEKRLAQLNELDPVVKKAWSDPFYC